MIMHRPPAELMLGYAAGTLPEPIALAVAVHAGMCPETAAEIGRLEGTGGALLDGLPPAPLLPGALERAMAALDREGAEAAGAGADGALAPGSFSAATRAMIPPPLLPYLPGDVERLPWRARGPHVATVALKTGRDGTSAFLLRVKAGRKVARHTHRGLELTLVLAGSYVDGGARYARGDIQAADPSLDHRPVADPGPDCLCLVALAAPIRLTGFIGRLADPFVKL